MESAPESSQPSENQSSLIANSQMAHGDRQSNDESLVIKKLAPLTLAEISLKVSSEPEPVEDDPRNRFTWSNLAIVLSIPAIATLMGFGLVCIYNPAAISWLNKPEAPAFYTNSFWNIPKSKKQIQTELAKVQLKLGDNFNLKEDQSLYTVLETETQNIREIRLYQTIWDRGEEKLLLVSTTTIAGIDEYFVRSPLLKYAGYEALPKLQPNRNRLPLKRLSLLKNPSDQYSEIWFTTSGSTEGITYGQIYCFTADQRSQLLELDAWTSPAKELPKWQQVLSNNTWQLVVNQTQKFEPSFVVWQPEKTDKVSNNPWQLRQVNLNEAKNQPKIYQDALFLASAGLWSPALEKFKLFVSELRSQNQQLSPFLQEQYDFISFHSQLTAAQTQQAISNLGEKALVNIIDGRWDVAIAIANDPAYKSDKIAEMVANYDPHIWQRVTAMLTYTGVKKEIKLWGGLVVLHRNGLRSAEAWLRSQKVDPKDSDQLLQRLDLAPIAINPKQLLGTVTYLGKGNVNNRDWFLPPPKLEPDQAWYEVNIGLIKNGDQWINAPFRELSDRSSILLWKVLGLSSNSNLGIVVYDAYGKTQAAALVAQSLWVGEDGSLRILASGQASLQPLLTKSQLPPLVTSGGAFNPPDGTPVNWLTLSPITIERIIRQMYKELQRNGQVSLTIEEFSVLIQQQWTLSSVNLDGGGKPEYLLLLEREQVDLGDRHYPLAIAFSNTGDLLFSDLNGGRVWIDVLPSSINGQILTLRNGIYEVWNFR
ncbi:hypothetical protein HCU40_14380 [Pseudanabaena biceps]|nr:hypothetical protein [Pseudanabaena biceps]